MQTLDKIQAFYHLLEKGQELFSLQSFLRPPHFGAHVKDMQFVAGHVKESRILELGAGVGQAVFLLGILRPDVSWVAIEKNSKKRGWMQIHRHTLGVTNISIYASLDN